jgi:hypothetical protein
VPQTVHAGAAMTTTSAAAAPVQLRHIGKKAHRGQGAGPTEVGSSTGGGAASAAVYPTVHLTGYYERAADEDDVSDGGMAMEMMEDEEFSEDE